MIRVTVSYPRKDGARFDHDYYRTSHRQLLVGRLGSFGLQRVEIDRCLSGGAGEPPATVAAAHMIFDALEGFQKGMAQHGKEIMTDVGRYTASGLPSSSARSSEARVAWAVGAPPACHAGSSTYTISR